MRVNLRDERSRKFKGVANCCLVGVYMAPSKITRTIDEWMIDDTVQPMENIQKSWLTRFKQTFSFLTHNSTKLSKFEAITEGALKTGLV